MPILSFRNKEKERRQHPQASLIPYKIWESSDFSFRSYISDDEIMLMQTRAEELISQLDTISFKNDYYLGKRAWLAIAFSHPELSDEVLMQIAKQLTLSDYDLSRIAIIFGKLSFFEKLISQYSDAQIQTMIKWDDYSTLKETAYHGHLPLLKGLVELTANQTEIPDYVFSSMFRDAARSGHLPMMEWLESQAPQKLQTMIKSCDFSAFRFPSWSLNQPVRDWLVRKISTDQLENMLTVNNCEMLRDAMQYGHTAIVNYLLQFPCLFVVADELGRKDPEARRTKGLENLAERYVNPFVTEKLAVLHAQKQEFLSTNPTKRFNLGNIQEVQLCFYLLKNLIANHDASLLDEVRFLLSIPAVKHMALTGIDPEKPNELRQFIVIENHWDAFTILHENVEFIDLTAELSKLHYSELYYNDPPPNERWFESEDRIRNALCDPRGYPDLAAQLFNIDKVVKLFQAIPPCVTTVNLNDDSLLTLVMSNEFSLHKLNNSLPNIQTIYLFYDEISEFFENEIEQLKAIFPNLKNTVFVNYSGKTLGVLGKDLPPEITKKPLAIANLAIRLGFPVTVPKLGELAGFFAKEKGLDITKLPEQVRDIVKKY